MPNENDLSILINGGRLAMAGIPELRRLAEGLVAVHGALHANWGVTSSDRDERLAARMEPVSDAMHRVADELASRIPRDVDDSLDRIAGMASVESYVHAGNYLSEVEAWVTGEAA